MLVPPPRGRKRLAIHRRYWDFLPSEGRGHRFESCRARHLFRAFFTPARLPCPTRWPAPFVWVSLEPVSETNHSQPTRLPWTQAEVELTVADYFHMLRLELSCHQYSKTAHRRSLQERLLDRSDSAVEMKHQNISAVLRDLGVMRLRGYQPLPNYQRLLFEIVESQLASDRQLDQAARSVVSQPAETPLATAFENFLVGRPTPRPLRVGDERLEWVRRSAAKRDYLEQESRNRALGLRGEKVAMEYEAERLCRDGRRDLADRIEHVSVEQGDGLGFDILSYDSDGRERFIEVKTTAFTAETPFFISQNEVRFSEESAEQFQLYRLFDFREAPRMFVLTGAVSTCRLDARKLHPAALKRRARSRRVGRYQISCGNQGLPRHQPLPA